MSLGSRRAQLVGGVVLGGAALWATLRDIEPGALLSALSGVDVPLAVAALFLSMAAVLLLAVRWKLLFAPDHPHVGLWTLFRAMVVGQMLNIASPVRVGEVARLYGISATERIPIGRVLATLAIEKALELSVFGAAAVTLLALVALPDDIVSARAAWLAMPLVAMAALWAAIAWGPSVARRIARLRIVPDIVRRTLIGFSNSFIEGIRHALSVRVGVRVLALSVAAMILPAAANQVLLHAFGLDLPYWAGLALLIVLQVGSVPPSLPGRLGIFNYLTVVTLVWLGVDRVTAASYSIALYAIAYVPKLLLGALFLALPSTRAADVVHETAQVGQSLP